MLIHSVAPLSFWVEALQMATFLLNRRPCRASSTTTPHELLLGTRPNYDELRVFGCPCYPNITATTPHKLSPRSAWCVLITAVTGATTSPHVVCIRIRRATSSSSRINFPSAFTPRRTLSPRHRSFPRTTTTAPTCLTLPPGLPGRTLLQQHPCAHHCPMPQRILPPDQPRLLCLAVLTRTCTQLCVSTHDGHVAVYRYAALAFTHTRLAARAHARTSAQLDVRRCARHAHATGRSNVPAT